MTTPYQMAINNVARAIRKQASAAHDYSEPELNAFTASTYLALAFCMNKEEVCADIIRADSALCLCHFSK